MIIFVSKYYFGNDYVLVFWVLKGNYGGGGYILSWFFKDGIYE